MRAAREYLPSTGSYNMSQPLPQFKKKGWQLSEIKEMTLVAVILAFLVAYVAAEKHSLKGAQHQVGITYLSEAASSGAVCLDGTVPAYHLQSGGPNWHIALEGGGWCESEQSCAARAKTNLGSSTYMPTTAFFNGVLSNNVTVNPDFYNWTHVFVRYCDGASFSADVDEPLTVSSGQVLYFRGKRIFKAVINELMSKGLSEASQVMLSGCSAGGLAVVHRCNELRSLLSQESKVKCLSDGGFFLNVSDISGSFSMSQYYHNVVTLHKLQNTLESSCTASRDSTQCFFPQFMEAYVEPPLFVLNAAYDNWQLEHVKKLARDQYSSCVNYTSTSCPAVDILQSFRTSMIDALSDALSRTSVGGFIDSCFTHCQALGDAKWTMPKIDNKSVAQTVGDWYFERANGSLALDCAYPCNPTCIQVID